MEEKLLQKVCEQVYQQLPRLKGCQPKVQPRPDGNTLLIFNKSETTEDGFTLPITVRVVVDVDGEILKTSTSR
jgi:hypothetical protein